MDIKLTDDGDIYSQTIVIDGWQETLQSVLIRLHRFKGEWILNDQAGLDYMEWKNRKYGNLVGEIRDRVRAEILRVSGVLSVDAVRVRLDENTRDVDIQANITIADPQSIDPVAVYLDTWEGITRVGVP